MTRHPLHVPRPFSALACSSLLAAAILGGAPAAQAQNLPPDSATLIDRPVAEVRFQGLSRVSRQKVDNNILTTPGGRYDPRTVQLDLQNLYRLGEFRTITVFGVLREDGSVIVVFEVREQPVLQAVQTVGNTLVTDQELLSLIVLVPGVPADQYLIEASKRAIQARYREKGYYLAEVEVPEEELEKSGVLLFRIIEGPRVRITAIEFQGNESFNDRQIGAEIKSREAVFLLNAGRLDEETLVNDVAAIDRYYKDRGYLDVRVGREIQLSPDSREAKLVFLVQEGRKYLLRNIDVAGSTLFDTDQIAALIELKTGDVYSQDKLRRSIRALREAYGELGYIDVRIQATEFRPSDRAEVNLVLDIVENAPSMTGEIIIKGNTHTKQQVILRELEFRPNTPLIQREIDESQKRLVERRLFRDPRITVLNPDPNDPLYRDVLVEIKEMNTGSVNFGVGVGTDSGVLGSISLIQRNFDIADLPDSWGELFSGRAFLGAGQTFNLTLQPGNEFSQYSVGFSEPRLLESTYSLRVGAFLRDRYFDQYDEERMNLSLGLGRRLGDVWSIGFNGRFERVKLRDIEEDAPVDVFDAEGPDSITGLGFSLTRNTAPRGARPGRGSVLELGIEQVGLLGGDFDFTKINAEYTVFLTINEDFLGRKSILKLNARASHILQSNEAPIYERFFLGGRSFRGFRFRTISPKGIRNDTGELGRDPVGGEWLLFLGAQYEFPLWDEVINGVFFVDSGTVTDDIGFDDYRVSVGAGLRLYVPAFGQAPIAFDFAIPVMKREGDRTQFFSFSAELPF